MLKSICRGIATVFLVIFGFFFCAYIFLFPVLGMLITLSIALEWSNKIGWDGPEQFFIIAPALALQGVLSFGVMGLIIGHF